MSKRWIAAAIICTVPILLLSSLSFCLAQDAALDLQSVIQYAIKHNPNLGGLSS